LDVRKMKDGDSAGFAAFNGDSGILTVKLQNGQYSLTMSEESVQLSNDTKEITDVAVKDVETVKLPKGKVGKIYLRIDGDFNPGRDTANFYYSFDGKTFTQIGTHDYKMRFDYRRLFMGTRYAAFYYPTIQTGGQVTLTLNN
ncbi:MAG: glycoside hydrolase, partial [Bacteroidaceae bacterium]|nr:glycoside hydrolase [Bacteroidaceae bacterium]